MRRVRDQQGTSYRLLKESAESSHVRNLATGEERSLPNDELEPIEDEPTLTVTSRAIPGAIRRLLTAVHDERALGLLLEIDDRGPVGVLTLLDVSDLCESDLHGLLGEFQAAGLVEETTVAGHRGYHTTDECHDALSELRD